MTRAPSSLHRFRLYPLPLSLLLLLGCKSPAGSNGDGTAPAASGHKFGSFVPPTEGQPGRSVLEFGAKGNGVLVSDGAITTGTANLACVTSLPFTSTAVDGGKAIVIRGAGVGGIDYATTISTVTDSGHAVVALNASTSVSNATVVFGSDDSGAFQAGIAAVNGSASYLTIPAKRFVIAAPIVLDTAQVTILGTQGAILNSAQNSVGGGNRNTAHDIFRAFPVYNGNQGTLNAAPAIGATSIAVNMTTKPVAGNWLEINTPAVAITAQDVQVVGACTGSSSPFTCTIDRGITMPFPSGASTLVNEATSIPHDIHIEGNGMLWTGSADRWMECYGCWRTHVQDIVANGSGGSVFDSGVSFDIGSRQVQWLRMNVDVTGAFGGVNYAIMMESTESGATIGSRSKGAAGGAGFLVDGVANDLFQNEDNGSATSFYLGQGTGLGAFDSTVEACLSIGATVQSFMAGVSTRAFFKNDASYASATGLTVSASSTGTMVRGLDVNGATTSAVQASQESDLDGINATNLSGTQNWIVLGGGNIDRLTNSRIATTGGSGNVINCNGASISQISNVSIQMGGAGENGIIVGNGVVVGDRIVTSGTDGTATGVSVLSGKTFRQGIGCDFSASATPVSNSGLWNRKQTVVANGTTGVVKSFPDIKTTDVVLFTLQTIGGTVGHPKYTIQPGASFTFTSDASDTSTYEWMIP